jgi:hypothetical protein
MSEDATHRQQQLYWAQMIELKVASAYIRRYREYLGKWVTSLGVLRAIASSGGIAAWALWRQYAFVWATVIAASQVTDALRDVFPFIKKHKAASVHTIIAWRNVHRRTVGVGEHLFGSVH